MEEEWKACLKNGWTPHPTPHTIQVGTASSFTNPGKRNKPKNKRELFNLLKDLEHHNAIGAGVVWEAGADSGV